jgi:hypothetical protein
MWTSPKVSGTALVFMIVGLACFHVVSPRWFPSSAGHGFNTEEMVWAGVVGAVWALFGGLVGVLLGGSSGDR